MFDIYSGTCLYHTSSGLEKELIPENITIYKCHTMWNMSESDKFRINNFVYRAPGLASIMEGMEELPTLLELPASFPCWKLDKRCLPFQSNQSHSPGGRSCVFSYTPVDLATNIIILY